MYSDPEGYIYFQDVLFRLLRKKFGYGINIKFQEYALRDKFNIIKKEEDHLIKLINEKIKIYYNKKHSLEGNNDKVFGYFNPLTSHLYYKISTRYLKLFVCIYNIFNY